MNEDEVVIEIGGAANAFSAFSGEKKEENKVLSTTLHQINPASVKCQYSGEEIVNGKKKRINGMITISGDIAKQFQDLPLGTSIAFQIIPTTK